MPVMPHHSTIWSFLPFHYCCQPVPAPFPSISQTTATLVSVHTSPSIKSYHQPGATLSLITSPSISQTSSSPPFHACPHLVHNVLIPKTPVSNVFCHPSPSINLSKSSPSSLAPSSTHLLPRFQPVSTPLFSVQVHVASYTSSWRLVSTESRPLQTHVHHC